MAARKIFGHVELPHEGQTYCVELGKEGLTVWQKRKHAKTRLSIKHILAMARPQLELFIVSKDTADAKPSESK